MDFKKLYQPLKKWGGVCFVLCLFLTTGMAQADGLSLGVMQFESKGVSENQVQKISLHIETAIQKTSRFNIVTRQLLDKIEEEREAQKYDVDQVLINQGKAIGADYIVTGTVHGLRKGMAQARDKYGNPINQIYTSIRVSYTIKVLEVKTGIIMANDTYTGSLNGIDHHIRNFIRVEFPYDFTILEILKKKSSKKAKLVLLDGGFKQGLQKGVYLEVFEVSEENVAGRIMKREVKIGDLLLRRLDTSGNFSMCSISKGKKEILKRIENGTNMVCKIPKSLRLFGMEYEYEY